MVARCRSVLSTSVIDTGERLGTNESAPGSTIEEQALLGARALEPLFNK